MSSLPYAQIFKNLIYEEMKGSLTDFKAPEGFDIDLYVEQICDNSFNDPDYHRLIEEHGSPDQWESDGIREFIQEHSDFYDIIVEEGEE